MSMIPANCNNLWKRVNVLPVRAHANQTVLLQFLDASANDARTGLAKVRASRSATIATTVSLAQSTNTGTTSQVDATGNGGCDSRQTHDMLR